MPENKAYASKKVFKKALFNIGFQIVPIAAAIFLTPILIEGLGKDFWAKYSTGISVIFLSNYFSFGIGPALNRRVSEIIGHKNYKAIPNEFRSCVSASYILGVVFFLILQVLLLLAYQSNEFSLLTTINDYYFYAAIIFIFFLVLTIIPYRSLLESFSDFYFLAIIRAFTASALFVIPFIIISVVEDFSLLNIAVSLLVFYVLIYILFYFRLKTQGLKYSFTVFTPLSRALLHTIFKFDLEFLKETLYFSLFFVSSSLVLFFDRFYYPIFFDTTILSDHITLIDLFNRVAILTGTISLVYFSAISVWYQEGNLIKIKKNLRLQLTLVTFAFLVIICISYFYLLVILSWWLGESYSVFIEEIAFSLLLAALSINFTILLIRPLQAIGYIKETSLWLIFSTSIYIFIVVVFGVMDHINYHFIALLVKAFIDFLIFSILLKKKNIL